MPLASDYIHPYKDAGGRPAHCRVRIYLPEDMRDAPVVICSELTNNPGGSITNSAEVIAARVIQANKLPPQLVWIEHRSEESTMGGEETFERVVFSSYEVVQRTPYLGESKPWIGDAIWKPLDRSTVEILSDGKALEGFLVRNQDLERLDALLDQFNIFGAPEWHWGRSRGRGAPRNTGFSKDRAR